MLLSYLLAIFVTCFRMRLNLIGESQPSPSALRPRKDLPSVQCWGFFVVNGLHDNFCGNKAIDAIARKEVVASCILKHKKKAER